MAIGSAGPGLAGAVRGHHRGPESITTPPEGDYTAEPVSRVRLFIEPAAATCRFLRWEWTRVGRRRGEVGGGSAAPVPGDPRIMEGTAKQESGPPSTWTKAADQGVIMPSLCGTGTSWCCGWLIDIIAGRAAAFASLGADAAGTIVTGLVRRAQHGHRAVGAWTMRRKDIEEGKPCGKGSDATARRR